VKVGKNEKMQKKNKKKKKKKGGMHCGLML
jgi:hypothetical protein